MPAAPPKKLSTRKPRGQGADRRGEIIEAGKALLLEEGYEGVSMRKVAARVGLSSTALYLHFREKDELLDAICYQVFDRLVPAMNDLLMAPDPPIERLRRGLTLYLRFGHEHPDEYRVVFLTRRPRDNWDHRAPLHFVDRWGHQRVNTFMYLVEGLRMCMAAGQIRQGDVMVMAETVLAAQHGLLALLILSPEQKWSAVDVLIHENVELIIRGLAT
jgi:AcrR family transcriptional regulator